MTNWKNIDLAKHEHILSVKHRALITKLCADLKSTTGFDTFCLTLFLHNGEFRWLVNTPEIAVDYTERGHEQADDFFNLEFLRQHDVIFFDEQQRQNEIQNHLKKVRQQDYSTHATYCLIRSCNDCIISIAVGLNKPCQDVKKLYQKTHKQIEDFANYFLDNTLSIYLEALPALKTTRFANDELFRQRLIRNQLSSDNPQKLTRSELAVLYWSSKGKTGDEIAVILELSNHTVATYRRRIIKKLNANNISHAIDIAKKQRLIV